VNYFGDAVTRLTEKIPLDQQNRDVVPALAAALERSTFNVQTILYHQVAGPLKAVL
jgi:hypothetical protein